MNTIRMKWPALFLLILSQIIHAAPLPDSGCVSNMRESAPDSRFHDNGDGTVTDLDTNLMWSKCSLGQSYNSSTSACDGTATTSDWPTALQTAHNLTYAGHNDWRLPSIKELFSLVETACIIPTINSTLFPATATSYYWTSTPATGASTDRSWVIGFSFGTSTDLLRNEPGVYARFVRNAQ